MFHPTPLPVGNFRDMKCTPYEVAMLHVKSEIAQLSRLSRTIASKNLDDQDAQRKAQATRAFVNSIGEPLHDTRADEPLRSEGPVELASESSHLPIELYQMIISHVANFDFASRQKTLVALSCSSKVLTGLAEEHLYTHPRDLEDISRQWRFLFSITVEPARASLVQSLKVLWLCDGANSELLARIAHVCPNASELLVQRGKDRGDAPQISNQDIQDMVILLDACPRLTCFTYSTIVEWRGEPQRYVNTFGPFGEEEFQLISDDPRLEKAARQLSEVHLSEQAEWVMQNLFPHLSSNLTSLHLGSGMSLGQGKNTLSDLSRRCLFLQELDIEMGLTTADDLIEACKAWGLTLRTLRINGVEELVDWVTQIMPYMKALEILDLGGGCNITNSDIEAIARSDAPLRYISFGDMRDVANGSRWDIATDELNSALVAMITSHSKTLKHLCLGLGVQVARSVLHSCKNAIYLHCLTLRPPPDTQPSDIDDLLETCPSLSVEPRARMYSLRLKEWRARAMDEASRCYMESRRDPKLYGFGNS
ncbi:hypothetical protein FSARC_11904 [Fusarium sarcochroum]|uniref:F-box domain-containing protein n=1 Tax=Fusarium sarcochroum TaxID=1208366 RepID=A0A8H4TCQ9_9HYPO|nr:hypothetical protein FSARC_11904 [Fusarium sarcochroum]